MNNAPLVTIGILNYNGVDFLKEIIPSVFSLSYNNFEVVVLDNGSTDNSAEFLKNNKNIRLISNDKNLGYGAGKNKIVENSNGEYVLLIDNDIKFINIDTIKLLLDFYKRSEKISFVSIPLLNKNGTNTDHYGLFFSSIKKELSIDKICKTKPFISGGYIGGCVFFKKNIFESLGGYDTIYPFNIDDYDLSARSWNMGYKIYILSTIYAEHIGIATRINIDSFCWKNKYYFCGFNRMAFKNYLLINLLIWFPIIFIHILYKTIRKCFEFTSFKPFSSFVKSIALFISDFSDTIKERTVLQRNRIIGNDIFLKIKPPIFN